MQDRPITRNPEPILDIESFKEAAKKQHEAKKESQIMERANTGKKRLNELKWPKHWTRAQKRRCVAAAKRAIKKGYLPDTPAWDHEMSRAGFKPLTK